MDPLFSIDLEQDGGAASHTQVPLWCARSLQHAAHGKDLVQFCAGSTLLALTDTTGCVWIFDIEAGGEPLHVLRGHGAPVCALCWVTERELVSASEDGSVRVWKLEV